jgi:hypothetical protein
MPTSIVSVPCFITIIPDRRLATTATWQRPTPHISPVGHMRTLIHVKADRLFGEHPLLMKRREKSVNHTGRMVDLSCATSDACPVVDACACAADGRMPCRDIGQAHDEKLKLCQAMEAIADTLPAAVDCMQCLRVANALVPLLREAHRYEEEFVFPVFERSGAARPDARSETIRRLKAEHVEDECAAQDLTDLLLEIGHGGGIDNPEALGFMLRAFFETIRRHIAFEREHVVPIVAARLQT